VVLLATVLPATLLLAAQGQQPDDGDAQANDIMGYMYPVGFEVRAPRLVARPDDDTKAKQAKAVEALGESPLAAVFEAIGPDARQYAQHNITLSNPFMEGRIPGSHGNRVAADYIEFWFKKTPPIPAFPVTAKAADGSVGTPP